MFAPAMANSTGDLKMAPGASESRTGWVLRLYDNVSPGYPAASGSHVAQITQAQSCVRSRSSGTLRSMQ